MYMYVLTVQDAIVPYSPFGVVWGVGIRGIAADHPCLASKRANY